MGIFRHNGSFRYEERRKVLTLDIREGVMSRRGESCGLPRVFFFRFETGAEHGATASSRGSLGAGRSMLALQVVVINRSWSLVRIV